MKFTVAAALVATFAVAVAEMAATQEMAANQNMAAAQDWPEWPDWEDLDWELVEASPLVVGKGKSGKGNDVIEVEILDPTADIVFFGGKGKQGKGKKGKGVKGQEPELPRGFKCKPGSYACETTRQGSGWKVCNVLGEWVYGGSCGKRERCEFNRANKSPYCLPYSWL
ncbi:hypothetical protein QBC40DRAFT_268652 [Triangularia verruculosa]|uniref:Uncharacterized protein n=1 Tax=Triangularia verruculosa TaxID=2587418 RepID=A0AAN7AR04_9PEZI|nr:hypothetical protein QBC40DRAFT_268652 [Triangularia verruculosa]